MRKKGKVAKTATYLAIILTFFAWALAEWCLQPVDGGDGQARVVSIPKGAGTSTIAGILTDAGVLKSGVAFKLYVKLIGDDGALKYGKYDIAPSESVRQIAAKLAAGIQRKIKLVVPEGYTAKQIAARAEAMGITSYEDFEALVDTPSPELLAMLPFSPQGSLEGYLFPDTYELEEDMEAKDVIAAMLGNFATKVADVVTSELKVDLTPREVIILASIVEKETLLESELPVVAGVFVNRLRKSMALQSCSTVQYVLPHPKAVLSKEDTLISSPYNTYRIQGLPPGAISNPGLAAIKAVLKPAVHDYLFFVANGDGSHSFSKTYGEHLKAKLRR